jgi:hypothetical protein
LEKAGRDVDGKRIEKSGPCCETNFDVGTKDCTDFKTKMWNKRKRFEYSFIY